MSDPAGLRRQQNPAGALKRPPAVGDARKRAVIDDQAAKIPANPPCEQRFEARCLSERRPRSKEEHAAVRFETVEETKHPAPQPVSEGGIAGEASVRVAENGEILVRDRSGIGVENKVMNVQNVPADDPQPAALHEALKAPFEQPPGLGQIREHPVEGAGAAVESVSKQLPGGLAVAADAVDQAVFPGDVFQLHPCVRPPPAPAAAGRFILIQCGIGGK